MKLLQFVTGMCLSMFILLAGCQSDDAVLKKELFNESAALTKVGGQPGTTLPLDWHMITMMLDKKRQETAVLYGNDIAFEYAKSPKSLEKDYPVHAKLALVTWLEKPDIHWFGANIPGTVRSVEEVVIERNEKGENVPVYSKYVGQELVQPKNADSLLVAKNINFILQLRRPYLPD